MLRPFDLLSKAIRHDLFKDTNSDAEPLASDLLTALDSDLTLENYDWESTMIVDLCDKLETELAELDETDDEEDEEEAVVEDDDEDDDEFDGIEEDEDDD